MRSALFLSSIDNPPRVIVVTSAFPAEGKTTTAVNLAIVLAQRRERVLLVDADLRRGSLHRVFGMSDQSSGLSTVLTQPGLHKEMPAPLAEVPTLHVMPTGPRPPNPAEMLSSNRMEEQMRQWTKQFDRIVIDSAPLLAVSDTQAMAVRADAVVLVARAGVTRKRALIRARDLLWRINAPVAGVVVNDVDMRLENFYTYRYGMNSKNYWYAYRQSAGLRIGPTDMKKKKGRVIWRRHLRGQRRFGFFCSCVMAAQARPIRQSGAECGTAPEDRLRRLLEVSMFENPDLSGPFASMRTAILLFP